MAELYAFDDPEGYHPSNRQFADGFPGGTDSLRTEVFQRVSWCIFRWRHKNLNLLGLPQLASLRLWLDEYGRRGNLPYTGEGPHDSKGISPNPQTIQVKDLFHKLARRRSCFLPIIRTSFDKGGMSAHPENIGSWGKPDRSDVIRFGMSGCVALCGWIPCQRMGGPGLRAGKGVGSGEDFRGQMRFAKESGLPWVLPRKIWIQWIFEQGWEHFTLYNVYIYIYSIYIHEINTNNLFFKYFKWLFFLFI